MKLLLLSSILPFQLLVVSSLTFYFGNRGEVSFDLLGITPFLVAFFIVSSLFVFLVLFLLRNSRLMSSIFSGILVGGAIALWIQSQLMVWDFGPLDGRGISWAKWSDHMLLEYMVWSVVFVVSILLFLKARAEIKDSVVKIVYFLGFFSIVSSFGAAAPVRMLDKNDSYEHVFSFHPEKNIIVIVLDTFQSDYFEYIAKNFPSDVEFLDGFKFYRNSISDHPTTAPNLPSIFSGRTYDNSVPFVSYVEEAFSDYNLNSYYKDKGYKTELVTLATSLPGAYMMRHVVDSMQSLHGNNILLLLDFGLFRALPSRFKSLIYSDGNWFLSRDHSGVNPPGMHGDDSRFVRIFEENAILDRDEVEGNFVFYHLAATHAPWQLNEKFEYQPIDKAGDERYIRHARGALTLVSRIFSKLDDLGIYDSSEIIVMADHGTMAVGPLSYENAQSLNTIPRIVHSSALPLLLHKKPFSRGDIVVDDSPLYLKDISCLLRVDHSGLDCSEFENAMAGQERSRTYMYYEWKHEYWQREFMPRMIEYILNGHAYDVNAWRLGDFEYDAGIKSQMSKYDLVGKVLLFTGQESDVFAKSVRTGWSNQELNHRWTDGGHASLFFRFENDENKDLNLRVTASPYLGGGGDQVVGVHVNGTLVGEWHMTGLAEYQMPIASSLLSEDGGLSLTFIISNPTAPCEVSDSTDCRKLGIAVRDLVFDYAEKSASVSSKLVPRVEALEALQALAFDAEDSSRNYLRAGWSGQEPTHRWTEGPNANMQFRIQDFAERDLVLRLNAFGYLGGGLPHQKVGVVVNGVQVTEWQVAGAAEYTAVIPANLVGDDGLINLSFDISDPRAPCDYSESTDCRKLGMAVRELVVDYVQ